MAIQFHPLPPEVFDEKARPYIKRLNAELREVFGLEGAIRQPINAKRSDNTISRRASVQVDVSRITPSITNVVSGVSTVVGAPQFTLGTVNAVGSTTTAVAIDSSVALFGTQVPAALAATAATGTSAYAARGDHVHLFPPTLQSTANDSTLALTDDATDQTLAGSLGDLNVNPTGGFTVNAEGRITFNLANSASASTFIVDPDTAASEASVVLVRIRPVAGSRTGMAPNFFSPAAGDTFSGEVFRCWDSQMISFAGQHTGCTFVGYDITTMTMAPSAGSSGGNCLYGIKNATFQINNTNASWTEAATAYFRGVRRSISSPTITTQAALIIEPPTCATSPQYGIYIRQQGAQATATTRSAIFVDAQNSGTNRFSFYGSSDTLYQAGVVHADGKLKHTGVQLGFYGTSTVAQSTGWTFSGYSTSKSLDGSSFTLNQLKDFTLTLAQRVLDIGGISL
jgi:hypothetical protein